jgi:hypothetical protein
VVPDAAARFRVIFLSQHAEEILSELSGLELVVEQSFRALAEIDPEKRAIRHEGGDVPTLPLSLVNERWKWWKARPRTAAWAARYGGDLDRVQQLFEASLAALGAEEARKWREEEEERSRATLQARVTRITRVGAAVVSGLLVVAVGLGVMFYRQFKIAERNYLLALQQTQAVAEKISDDLSSGAVSAGAAKELLATTDDTIHDLQDIKQTPEATSIGVKILFAYSDSW